MDIALTSSLKQKLGGNVVRPQCAMRTDHQYQVPWSVIRRLSGHATGFKKWGISIFRENLMRSNSSQPSAFLLLVGANFVIHLLCNIDVDRIIDNCNLSCDADDEQKQREHINDIIQ